MNLTYFRPEMRGNVENNNTSVDTRIDVMLKYQKWQFWCCFEVAATELHLCFVIKGNVWWKRAFLPMATIVVLHHKHMKLFKPFTPHVIAWSVRKGFHQSIRRTKEQKARLQCLASAMPKPVLWCHQDIRRAMKSGKLLRKNVRIWQC